MFISVGITFEANVEALNMVETAGNYSKHRRVPYFMKDDEGNYKTIYVPAISGESLAHAYQVHLVNEAHRLYGKNAPVCPDCEVGGFFKSMDMAHLKKKLDLLKISKDPKKMVAKEIEEAIIKSCLVEDIGGFMYAEKPPVRRTSVFQVSYALPVKTSAVFATTEPQLHARHAQMTGEEDKNKAKTSEQMIYYVETGSAIYGMVLNLDLDSIGISSQGFGKLINDDDIKKRKQVAINALLRFVSSQQFGAKLSRFFPVGGIISLTASLTEGPFSVTSPIYEDHTEKTLRRLSTLKNIINENVKYVFTENIQTNTQEYDFASSVRTPEEAISELIDYLKQQNVL